MLYKKARPKRLLTKCKEDNSLARIYHDIVCASVISSNNEYTTFGKALLTSIPVLSIFVLLGIISYAVISPVNLSNLFSNIVGLGLVESNDKVYAADSTGSTSSLIIDNGNASDSTTTVRGGVTYSSHTVQVKADNITGYTLSITGPTNMTTANTSSPTTITGANNNTPANMANNTWGYGWGATSTANTSLSYNSFTGSAQTLENNTSINNNTVDLTKKLVFAAKFGDTAASGHYKANVKLNLTVTPKVVTTTTFNYSVTYNLNGGTGSLSNASGSTSAENLPFAIPNIVPTKAGYRFLGWSTNNSITVHYKPGDIINLTMTSSSVTLSAVWTFGGITTMQEMDAAICKNAATIGDTVTLVDTRDDTTYTIQKLSDGNCWMTQNLRLDPATNKPTSTDSDITSSTSVTYNKLTGNFSSSNTAIQFRPASSNDYGAYYSWCAATAGTCSKATTAGAIASDSICPKGWKLPMGGTTIAKNTATSQTGNDFANLIISDGKTIDTLSSNPSIPNTLTSTSPKYSVLGGTNWYAGGAVDYEGIYLRDSVGNYWSRTSKDGTHAYELNFDNSKLQPANNYSKFIGLSVRCIAYSS